MTIEEIRNGAPVGSTHYMELPTHINYFMDDGFNFKWNICGEWVEMARVMVLLRIGIELKPL